MASGEVTVVEELIDAASRRDVDAFLECCHPNVVWQEPAGGGLPGLPRESKGLDEVRKWFGEVMEFWVESEMAITEITTGPSGAVLTGASWTTRGSGSGAETTARFWQVFWFREGKVVRRMAFNDADRDEARQVAGLPTEDAAS